MNSKNAHIGVDKDKRQIAHMCIEEYTKEGQRPTKRIRLFGGNKDKNFMRNLATISIVLSL